MQSSNAPAMPRQLDCENEPIHMPASIQPHGIIMMLDAASLIFTHLSDNFLDSTGVDPNIVYEKTLADVLGERIAERILQAVATEAYSPANAFTLELPFCKAPARTVVAHVHQGKLILELEPSASDREEEALVARAQSVMSRFRGAPSSNELWDLAARCFRELTGYDRVMIYRFDAEWNGEVVAEDRDPALAPYLGLRYPASDIPPQARRLYLLQRVRMIVDVGYIPVTVVPSPARRGQAPVDMSFCCLRSVSPIHLEYRRNMGVAATFAISLNLDDRLWGMVVAHHGVSRSLPPQQRALCDLLGQMLAVLIGNAAERDELARHLERHQLIDRLKRSIDKSDSIVDALSLEQRAFLEVVGANGAAVRLGGRLAVFGDAPSSDHVSAALGRLRPQLGDDVLALDKLPEDRAMQDGNGRAIGGVMLLPILNNSADCIAWFRPEVARTVKWGGDPAKPVDVSQETGRISPRKSFAAWTELVRGQSLPWSGADVLAAQDVRRLISRGLLRQAEARLARLSLIDALTGLANRRSLDDAIAEWRSSKKATPGGLLFLDMDRFKTVNDSLGHPCGDELLIQVARRLRDMAGEDDFCARLGGDEFVLFARGVGRTRVEELAAKMLRSFEHAFTVAGRPHRATASIGLAHSDRGVGDLLREADAAMYEAKRRGGNCVASFDNSLHERVLSALRTEQDLFLALERREFVLHYQPVVSLKDGALIGFEALARWRHPERGWVSPAEFIPRAEESGLIVSLGAWVLETGLIESASWPAPVRLSINVSPRQLTGGSFANLVRARCAQLDVSPERLTIEVTEGVLMDETAVTELDSLRGIGCRIAIDDFGTGYSSLAYLQRLPVDVLKIDRAFIESVGTDRKAQRIVAALVALAHTLNLSVVAEGVENDAQRNALTVAGCDAAQGYLVSRPLDPRAAKEFLSGLSPAETPSASGERGVSDYST